MSRDLKMWRRRAACALAFLIAWLYLRSFSGLGSLIFRILYLLALFVACLWDYGSNKNK